MMEPCSIILAVISTKNNFANQIILRLAWETDPSGSCTLGVITKPDSLVAGLESKAQFASLAKNQEVEFCLRWHVLKNMDSEKGKWNLAEHDCYRPTCISSRGTKWQNIDRISAQGNSESEADSGGSYIRNPLPEVVCSGELTEGVEGPIARGYIAE